MWMNFTAWAFFRMPNVLKIEPLRYFDFLTYSVWMKAFFTLDNEKVIAYYYIVHKILLKLMLSTFPPFYKICYYYLAKGMETKLSLN